MDLRLPIGLLFLVFGLLLTALGASTPPTLYAKSLGINVNLLWGVVMTVFGGTFFALSLYAHRCTKSETPVDCDKSGSSVDDKAVDEERVAS
jgi:hypothetical protein